MGVRRVLAVVLGLAMPFGQSSAQEVSGVLLAEDGVTPVQGVLVQANNAISGLILARTRTGLDGAFRLRIGTDSVEVRALRLGSRPTVVIALRLREGAVHTGRFVLRTVPVELPVSSSVASTRCEAASASSTRLAAGLFEQVIAALAPSSDSDSSIVIRVSTRRVAWTADERQRLSDQTRDSVGTWPVRPLTRQSDDLFERGFLLTDLERRKIYLAPSAEFFSDDRFLREYCLYYAGQAPANENLIGVAFRPARGRSSDVRLNGTFWFRRGTSRLERLTFAYEGLPPAEASGRAEGWLRFAPLVDGQWATVAWQVRMPQVREVHVVVRRTRARSLERSLNGILIFSGELTELSRGGASLFVTAPDSLR